MAHLKGHDEHNKSSNGSYAQKIIFHPQNGTTMCLKDTLFGEWGNFRQHCPT